MNACGDCMCKPCRCSDDRILTQIPKGKILVEINGQLELLTPTQLNKRAKLCRVKDANPKQQLSH
jgi:hypothetical protein